MVVSRNKSHLHPPFLEINLGWCDGGEFWKGRGGGGGGVGGGEGKFKFAERRDTHQHEESTLTCTQRGCDYLDLYKQTM